MEYLALYRKYRPKNLDEVVGQCEIKKILASSVKNNTITHAYLFSGPRGTGKTTMAKILAKMVNCLNPVDGAPCNECDSCLNVLSSPDVIEIDAASNNGVDEIRDLREKANLVPSTSKYKVYIIDEVHMLTTQAFNALLKTLEEPPKHVIFILATTEYYKIPLTITSRCQKFQFNKLNDKEIVEKLTEIADLEKIKITDDALLEIAKLSDGGMRDSINYLDQLRSFTKNKITIDAVYEVCGDVPDSEVVDLFKAIRENNCQSITTFFEKMDTNGKSYAKFLENIICFMKDIILLNNDVDHKYIKSNISTLEKINTIFSTDEIFYMVEAINALIDRLKNVSKQSVVVVTNFLLIMNHINSKCIVSNVDKMVEDSENTANNVEYDMAFNFTAQENADENKKETPVDEDNKEDESAENVDINKEIIVNNAFAVASKDVKNSLQELLQNVNDYLTDKKYKTVAGLILDLNLEVAGDNYLIFSVSNEAIVDKIDNKYKSCYEFITLLFGAEYNFVVLTSDEWKKYRDEYVLNFKNGVKYEIKELKKVSKLEKKKDSKTTIVDKLFDLVGEDSVEFK